MVYDGPDISSTGDITSSALSAISDYPDAGISSFGEIYFAEGQIIQIYTVDDPKNDESGEPGKFSLFDVLIRTPDGGSEIVRRCRVLQPVFGGEINNFFEVIPTDPKPKIKEASEDSSLQRGSKVLIGFISGQRNSGIILGSLPHPNKVAVKNRPAKDDKSFLGGEFQGLNFSITDQGAFTLTFNGPRDDQGEPSKPDIGPTTIGIDEKGNIKVETNQDQSVEIDREKKTITLINGKASFKMEQEGGKITVECDKLEAKTTGNTNITAKGNAIVSATGQATVSSAQRINLQKGKTPSIEPMVLGIQLNLLLTQLIKALLSHQHIGNLGAPTPLFPASIPQFSSLLGSLPNHLSSFVFGTK